MISLAKTCSRSSLSSRSRSAFLRSRNGTVVGALGWCPTLAVMAAVRPATAGQLFSTSRPFSGGHRLLCKAAPMNEAASGAQGVATRAGSGQGEGTVRAWVRDEMIKDRKPLSWASLEMTTNVSNLCGHLSFVVLALAYLETDVLALRGYAASGIGLSILFQFYRKQPLWIPISWNGLFLVINASMIALLLKERREAANIGDDPEQEKTFQEVFVPVELTPVDFVRLMDVAERRVVPKGTRLSEEGKPQEEVFLIVEGSAEVEAEGDAVGHLERKQFVGSMAFNRFMQASPSSSSTLPPSTATAATADADGDGDGTADGTDSNKVTTENNKGATDTSASSHGETGATTPEEGHSEQNEDRHNKPGGDYTDEGDFIDDGYLLDSTYEPGGPGVFEEAKEVARNVLRRDSIVGSVAHSFVLDADGDIQQDAGGMERSGTTVTTTTDAVVYAWDMLLLRAFIKRRPLAGAAFQKAISSDLVRKVDQSRGAKERYRLLLAEALDGGVITPIEKKKLQRYRDMHGISSAEHLSLLEEYEWREEEFDAGFQKGVAPRDGSKHFLKYEDMVRQRLAKGQVKDEERHNLRQFRTQAGIDAQEHLIALEKQGWTADDYEAGGKGKARTSATRRYSSSIRNDTNGRSGGGGSASSTPSDGDQEEEKNAPSTPGNGVVPESTVTLSPTNSGEETKPAQPVSADAVEDEDVGGGR